MKLRHKLLIGSIATTLGIVALFVGVTFTSAVDFNREQIPRILEDRNLHLVAMLPEDPSLEQILAMLPHHETRSDSLAVIDDQGRLYDNADHYQDPDGFPPPRIDGRTLLDQPRGDIRLGQEEFLWVTTPIPGTPYQLVDIHRRQPIALRDFVKYIGIPIAFAAIVSLYLSAWGAMIIASLFRRVEEQRAQLEHQAHHDPLTDLPNRDTLTAAIEKAIEQGGLTRPPLAVCMIDLHQFKEINDSLGHHRGDELLRQVATRLRMAVKEGDTVGRFYGNKFAVLMTAVDPANTEHITETLLGALDEAFDVDGHSLYVRGTLGIALYPRTALSAPILLQQAEAAIFQARERASHSALYHDTDTSAMAVRLGLINDLRNALRDGALDLYYQPKLDLRSGHIVGVEALARWNHPDHGFIAPDQFIDIAERTGLIKPLTRWVLETAIQQCARCQARGKPLKVSANLSPINLHDEELVSLVRELLERYRLDPAKLVLEVTETAMMHDPERARLQLERLDALGICISIDDFGTGYSSLGHLRRLPVDEIKIDKSFVMDMIDNEGDASIVRATVGLAHDLNLDVVAEGVEDEVIMERLREMGCDIAQGYHIARPLPERELLALLEAEPRRDDGQARA